MFAPNPDAVDKLAGEIGESHETRTLAAIFGTTPQSVQAVARELASSGAIAWSGGGEGLRADAVQVWLDPDGHSHVTLEVPGSAMRVAAAAALPIEEVLGGDAGPGGTDVVVAQLNAAAARLAEHANGLVDQARRLAPAAGRAG